MTDYCYMSGIELREAIKRRELTAERLTSEYIERIKRYDVKLNTLAELNENALNDARALDSRRPRDGDTLFGLPILIKDNIDVAGLHTTAGSLALADNVAKKNSPIVDNIIARGGIILGKANMTEFANFMTDDMPNGFSSRGGFVRNAYDADKDPGGSSTGSAVAVSAGFCAMAVGTDTCFSVVGCAAENGVVGYKPPVGTLSPDGIIPISRTLDSAGTLTRTLSDSILLCSAMAGMQMPDIAATPASRLRIGVNTFDREEVSDEQLKRYDVLLDALKRDGAIIEEITQPFTHEQGKIMICEFRRDLEQYLATSAARLKKMKDIVAFYDSDRKSMAPYGTDILEEAVKRGTDEAEYATAMAARQKARTDILAELQKYDAVIMTGPTNIMHFTGLPSLALKLVMADDDTPRGVILYGADEKRLLSAALTIDACCTGTTQPLL